MSLNIPEAFKPRWHSVFYNPFFILRRRLFQGIERNAHHIGGMVLDFGCGNKPYLDLFKYEKYIGLDYKTEVSMKYYGKADVFYDGKTIPFPENHFDSVFSSEVLEHVFNPDEILKELHRVLKPGGHMLLTCPFFWPEHEQPYDYARYSSFGLKHLLEKGGFEIVHYEKTGSFVEAMLQSSALYINYFIPGKPAFLRAIFFTIFITPILLAALALARILPRRIKRDNLYLNNVVVVRKP